MVPVYIKDVGAHQFLKEVELFRVGEGHGGAWREKLEVW